MKPWTLVGLAALSLAVGVVAYGNVPPPPPGPPQPPRAVPAAWEYKFVAITYGGVPIDEKALNDLGADGWEVVESVAAVRGGGAGPMQTDSRLVLRRPKR